MTTLLSPISDAPRRSASIAAVLLLLASVLVDFAIGADGAPPLWLRATSLVVVASTCGAVSIRRVGLPSKLGAHVSLSAATIVHVLTVSAVVISLGASAAALLTTRSGRNVSVAEAAALLVVLFLSSRRGRRDVGAVVAALTVAALVVLPLRIEAPAQDYQTMVTILILLAAVSAALGLYGRSKERSRDHATQLAREHERMSVAADVHDIVAHHLTSVLLQTQMARMMLGTDPARVATLLVDIEKEAAASLTSVRAVIGALRVTESSPDLEPVDDLTRLPELVRYPHTGPRVRFDIPDTAATLPLPIQSALYRITREALTNITRHSPHATEAHVDISQTARTVTLRIDDDGPAVDGVHSGGIGLISMRTRAETLGGTLHAGPGPDGRWQVRAEFPRHRVGR